MMSTLILQKEALGRRRSESRQRAGIRTRAFWLHAHSHPFLQPPHQRQRTSAPAPGQACLWKAEMDFAFFYLQSQLGAGHSVATDGMNNPEFQPLAWNPVS